MDAAMVTAVAALISSPVAAAAAMYGSRGVHRAQRESGAAALYDNLTARLIAERDKAEADEAAAEARAAAAEAKLAALEAEKRAAALEAEICRLRQQVTELGGRP